MPVGNLALSRSIKILFAAEYALFKWQQITFALFV